MYYKPEWAMAKAKLETLWNGTLTGRPCIAVTAPRAGGSKPPAAPTDPEDRWLNPEWILANLRANLSGTWWGGESIPSHLLMAGWLVSAGGRPHFSHETIWFDTFDVDFKKASPFRISQQDPWIIKHRRLYEAVAKESSGEKFLLGHPLMLPAHDLLSMHMGTDRFLMALMDEPEWMRSAIIQAARDMREERLRLQAEAKKWTPYWYGNAGWMPFWAPKPFTSTQSDVSCMLSPEMFEQFVVPELDFIGKELGAMWYHLDGHNARQHLPRLLSLPYMRVIQYTPTPTESPNGPEHLEFYRTIQKAGKIVHIELSAENLIQLAGKLDPALLMLNTSCTSESEGRSLLEKAKKW